jgi:serine protease AprX
MPAETFHLPERYYCNSFLFCGECPKLLAETWDMKFTNSTRLLLLAFLIFGGSLLKAQQRYWVFLADKGPEQGYWLAHPEGYLSAKALARQAGIGHAPAVADLPLSETYRNSLAQGGVKIRGASRWINALSVETSLSLRQLQAICPAVTGMQPVGRFVNSAYDGPVPPQNHKVAATDSFAYGQAQAQIEQLNLKCLHDRGFTGRNVLIAVFDAGFLRMDTIAAFDSLWQQGRVLTYYDFVNHDNTVFDEHNHGMNVSSTIVGNLPGQMIGTAPHATLALARTEDVFSETHQEEDNWLRAVEWADSLGADQIQSSLGYSLFDSGQGDFVYSDLDGNTTIITRAADMAAARGILVVNSAGNEGTAPWHHITAPCDADSILCVGAVDASGGYVSFSGVGPSADGRVKPDVAALGLGVAAIGNNGNVGGATGTSFATPLMSGFAACLKQAHPQRNNMDIIQAIRQSASQFATPDTLVGYGIPDACKADSILTVLDSLELMADPQGAFTQAVNVFPNPATEMLILENKDVANPMSALTIIAADGRTVFSNTAIDPQETMRTNVSLKSIPAGVYFARITLRDGHVQISRFIKR